MVSPRIYSCSLNRGSETSEICALPSSGFSSRRSRKRRFSIGRRIKMNLFQCQAAASTQVPMKASRRKWLAVATMVRSIDIGHSGAMQWRIQWGLNLHKEIAIKREFPKCRDGIAAIVSWNLLLVQVEPPFSLLCRTSMKPYSSGRRRGGIHRHAVMITNAITFSIAIVRLMFWYLSRGRKV